MNTSCQHYPNRTNWLHIIAALALAWFNRFVQDDAFISFRYAQNLAAGHGLVYNLGERVEGYTNFLWTVCMVPAFLLNADIVAWSYVLSLLAYAVTLLVTARLALCWFRSPAAGFLAVILLATNYSFSCYATGGLETQFGIAWVLLSVWLLHIGRLVPAALCSACAIMTRMDAILILFPFWCATASFGDMLKGSPKHTFRVILSASAGALLVVVWLVWRHHYYGAWLPNTFLIKGQGPTPLRGLCYAGLFYAVYGLWLLIPLFLKTPFSANRPALYAILLWHVYIIAVGGDFMEFRMMMPSLPLAMIFVAGLLANPIHQKARYAMPAVLAIISLLFGMLRLDSRGGNNIHGLATFCAECRTLANEMGVLFGEQRESVKIAITAAGTIPFYTQMPTLDLLGLNNQEVARTGERLPHLKVFGNRPGHVRIAKPETVIAENVNLLLNHPWVVEADNDVLSWTAERIAASWPYSRVPFQNGGVPVPPVIVWPLSDGRYWITLYMKPHPVIDAAITRTGATVILPAHE